MNAPLNPQQSIVPTQTRRGLLADSNLNNPPPRAFLFDIGNVLLKFDFSICLKALAAQSDLRDPLATLARFDQVKAAYEDGQFDRAAFLRAVFDVLCYRGSEEEFISAWENIFEPNEPVLALVERLRARYPLFLLSNTNDIHRAFFLRRYPFFRHFTAGTYSDLARASKPSRAIFEIACRDLALEPASTFFIDDLLPNIETARAFGFQTHHYHHDRHDELLAALETAGVEMASLTAQTLASAAEDMMKAGAGDIAEPFHQ